MSMRHGTARPAVASVRIIPRASARGIADHLLRRAGMVLRAGLAGHRRRRTERMLSSLSDAALEDIGIRRSEIRAIADALTDGGTPQRRFEH